MSVGLPVFWRFLCIGLMALGAIASADTYVLFAEPGKPVPEYDQIVDKLKAGDEVVFSNGDRFTIKRWLGAGKATGILETSDGRALRIPLLAGPVWKQTGKHQIYYSATGPEFMAAFIAGHARLAQFAIPAPEMYQSLESEYALMEKLEVRFSLSRFALGLHGLSPADRAKVFEELVEFARQTWRVSDIGDLGNRQVLYTSRGWKLVDHNADVTVAARVGSPAIFARRWYDFGGTLFLWSRAERQRLTDVIAAERRAHGVPDRKLSCREYLLAFWNGTPL